MLSSAILPLKLRIALSDCFPDFSYLCVVFVYNDCHRTIQNHHSKMGRTSHLSDAYVTFSSLCNFFLFLSLMTMTPTNKMTTVQGMGSLLVRDFRYVLKYSLIGSFGFNLVEPYLVDTHYSQYLRSTFPALKLL